MIAVHYGPFFIADNKSVTVAVKGLLGKCGCTRMVQGGYNVALAPGDSVERHFMDTIVGGKWLPHQEMAWRLCETAVVRVRELENEIERIGALAGDEVRVVRMHQTVYEALDRGGMIERIGADSFVRNPEDALA